MAPAALVAPIVRVAGYVLFLVWCALVAVTLATVGLLRVVRLVAGWGRTSVVFEA
jgi:hypothetical protein